MLSCKDVCYIVSESLDGKLPWRKRFRVKTHLMVCKACQRMVRQMKLMQSVTQRYGLTREKESRSGQELLSKEASARILARLQQMENDSNNH